MKKRRKKQSNSKSAPQKEQVIEPAPAKPFDDVSPPVDPPKKNLLFLISVSSVFAVWVGLLVWLCFRK